MKKTMKLELNDNLVYLRDSRNAYAGIAQCSGCDTIYIVKSEGDIKQRAFFSRTLSGNGATMRFMLEEKNSGLDMKMFELICRSSQTVL